MSHVGRCFCGAVTLEVTGAPEAMGYCHCSSCRSWSAAPVNAFTLWKPEAVKITAGAEHLATFAKTKMTERQYCKKCGGHLMANHPTLGLADVYAATIPTLRFAPSLHVNYGETVLPMRDGLPKWISRPSMAAPVRWSRSETNASNKTPRRSRGVFMLRRRGQRNLD
jgi:hypothetical protein